MIRKLRNEVFIKALLADFQEELNANIEMLEEV